MSNTLEDANYIYYNIRIRSNGQPTLANYDITKTVPVLKEALKYQMVVERFKLPSEGIPIFFWKTDYWNVTINNTTVNLQFIPNRNTPPKYGKDGIWNIYEFITSLNNALQAAYIAEFPAGTTPPFVTYNTSSKLCTFWKTESEVYDIYFNDNLYNKFQSFNYFENQALGASKQWQLLITNNYGLNVVNRSGTDYLTTVQEYQTVNKWSMLQRILFKTTVIPLAPELEGETENVTQGVITDFEPFEDNFDLTTFQYFASGALRLIDIISSSELRSINVRLFWKDEDGNEYPYILDSEMPLTIKLLFRKKLKYQLEDHSD